MYKRISQHNILHRLGGRSSQKFLSRTQQWAWRPYSAYGGNPYIATHYQRLIQHADNKTPMLSNFTNDVLDYWSQSFDQVAIQYFNQETNKQTMLSYPDLIHASHQIGHYFLYGPYGLQKGDPIGLLVGQHPAWYISLAGAMRAGLPVVLLPRLLSSSDLIYRINDLGVKAVIAQPELHHKIEEIQDACPSLDCLLTTGDQDNQWQSLPTILQGTARLNNQHTTTEDACIYLHTSGTTGFPKAVRHNCDYPLVAHYTTGSRWMQLVPGDVVYNASDTGWGFSVWTTMATWAMGVKIFASPTNKDFDPQKMLILLRDQKITVFCAAPTVLRRLVAESNFKDYTFPGLKRIVTVGEALDETVIQAFEDKGIAVHVGFGQAETPLLIGRVDEQPHIPHTMGKAISPYNVVLLDETLQPVASDEPGQIAVDLTTSPRKGIMQYYENAPERTAQVFPNDSRYYLTGDWAKKYGDDFVYQGRKDDLIKAGKDYPYRIGPDEIEKAGMSHNKVAKIAAISVPDDVSGDHIIQAKILLKPNYRNLSDNEKRQLIASIKQHITNKAGEHKCPDDIEFLDEKEWSQYETTSGKIRRVAFREREQNKQTVKSHPLSQSYGVKPISQAGQKIETFPPSSILRPGR